jgi:N12 class adenine-specific DNA methylase
LPKTNYQYEKRQKELDKKKKKAEKVRLKEARKTIKPEENPAPMPEK